MTFVNVILRYLAVINEQEQEELGSGKSAKELQPSPKNHLKQPTCFRESPWPF